MTHGIRNMFKTTILSKDGVAALGIKGYEGALKNLKSLADKAVLIESTRNTKKDFTTPVSNDQKRNNEVKYYHRFYVPVSLNGKMYVERCQ